MERAFGPELARCICCRLAVLRSAPVLGLLPKDPPIALTSVGRSPTRYTVALGTTHRLEFEVTDPHAARDGSTITGVTIIGVKAAPSFKERTP